MTTEYEVIAKTAEVEDFGVVYTYHRLRAAADSSRSAEALMRELISANWGESSLIDIYTVTHSAPAEMISYHEVTGEVPPEWAR